MFFLKAGRASLKDFTRAKPEGNSKEEICQPKKNPIHPSSFYSDSQFISNVYFHFPKYQGDAEQTLFSARLCTFDAKYQMWGHLFIISF